MFRGGVDQSVVSEEPLKVNPGDEGQAQSAGKSGVADGIVDNGGVLPILEVDEQH